jgi:uncharacterized repeat protein (TIGR01451 family)
VNLKNLFTLLFVGLLLFGASTTANFVPENGRVTSLLYVDVKFDDRLNIDLGSNVTFDIVVKNLTNNSISNLTITQTIPQNLDLIEVMGQDISDVPGNFNDLSAVSSIGPTNLAVRYLNITASNFTTNLDITMASGDSIGLRFVMQANQVASPSFSAATVSYYDHWGDRYNAVRQETQINLDIDTSTTPPYLSFIPDFDTTDTDYTLIIGLTLGTALIALLGRVLYLKKPIEL